MSSETQRLLVFDVSGLRYAVKLEDVAEILEPSPTYPVPRVSPVFLGATNFHGRVVAVLDLAAFFDTGAFTAGGKYVVLNRELTNLALAIGPNVDIVTSDVILEEEESGDPLVGKILVMADGEVNLLETESLLLHLEELLHG